MSLRAWGSAWRRDSLLEHRRRPMWGFAQLRPIGEIPNRPDIAGDPPGCSEIRNRTPGDIRILPGMSETPRYLQAGRTFPV